MTSFRGCYHFEKKKRKKKIRQRERKRDFVNCLTGLQIGEKPFTPVVKTVSNDLTKTHKNPE